MKPFFVAILLFLTLPSSRLALSQDANGEQSDEAVVAAFETTASQLHDEVSALKLSVEALENKGPDWPTIAFSVVFAALIGYLFSELSMLQQRKRLRNDALRERINVGFVEKENNAMQKEIGIYIERSKSAAKDLENEIKRFRRSFIMCIDKHTAWDSLDKYEDVYKVELGNITLTQTSPKLPAHIPPEAKARVSEIYVEINNYALVAKDVEKSRDELLKFVGALRYMRRIIDRQLSEYKGDPPASPMPMEYLAAQWEEACKREVPAIVTYLSLGYTSVEIHKLLEEARNVAKETENGCGKCLSVIEALHQRLKDFTEMRFRIFKGELEVDKN